MTDERVVRGPWKDAQPDNFGEPTPVDEVLGFAKDQVTLTDAVVLGWEKNGSFYFASSQSKGGDILWLLEAAKTKLLRAGGV